MMILWQCFSENIHNLKILGEMRKSNNLIIVGLADVMTINLNVFRSLLKHLIFSDPDFTLVVSMKRSGLLP